MKQFAISIAVFAAAQASLWAWGPHLARWQLRNALERYGAAESLETLLQAHQAAMQPAYVEAGIAGAAMLVAAAMLLRRQRAGWFLWLACLGASLLFSLFSLNLHGLSIGTVLRILVLLTFAMFSLRTSRNGKVVAWLQGSTVQ